jgi:hypothetical protein
LPPGVTADIEQLLRKQKFPQTLLKTAESDNMELKQRKTIEMILAATGSTQSNFFCLRMRQEGATSCSNSSRWHDKISQGLG